MAQQEYEVKKRELWIDLALDEGNANEVPPSAYKRIFNNVFDRAYALGKQEKDADSFEIGDKVRVKETNQIGTIIEPYSNDVGYRVYFDDGDGGEDAEYSADQLELYKKIIVEPKDANTVIQGWVARSNDRPNDLGLRVYTVKPDRRKNRNGWNGHGEMSYLIDCRLFPDLTWESEPEPIEIIIKRKKK